MFLGYFGIVDVDMVLLLFGFVVGEDGVLEDFFKVFKFKRVSLN